MLLSPPSSSSYFLLDLVVTLTLFGFFDSSQFDIRNVYEKLNIGSDYSFTSSPLDFLILSVLRFIMYTTCHQLRTSGKSSLVSWLDKPITSFCVCCLSFSFLKCLVYSEQKELLECTGVYYLPAWNIISTAVFYRLWSNELCAEDVVREEKNDDEEDDEDVHLPKIQQIMILLRYSSANWPWLVVGFAISLASSAVNVAMPHYTSLVMNGITALREGVDMSHAIKILAVLTLASMLLTGFRSGIFTYLSSITVAKMRKDLFKSIICQEIAFFDKHKSGEIVSRITSDVDGISYRITDMFTFSLLSVLTLGGKVLIMGNLSWRLTLINFIAFPIITYVTKLYGDFYEKMGDQEGDASADSHQVVEEIISTIRTIRSFGAEQRSAKRFDDAIDKSQELSRKEAFAGIGLHISYDLYHNFIYVIVLIYGARLVSTGSMESAALITFMMYQLEIGQHIVGLTYEIPQFMGTLGKSRKFCEFLVRQPKMSTSGTNEQPVKGQMRLDGVSFTYPNRPTNQVLKDLTLHIRAGETLAFVGPSGGGKSTIVSLLERFYDPEEGEITLDGVPIEEYDHEYYHRKIALVAQEPVLYDCSVRENIGFGCDATEEEIIDAAKTANAHDFVMGLEKGYETSCGEKGTQMSGGQKQRIAIARALVCDPSILILDEATSALDNQSEQIVQEAMQRCAINRTVIVIAHRLSTIEKADRIAVIDKGRVVQLGTHRELLEDKKGLYHTLVRAKEKEH